MANYVLVNADGTSNASIGDVVVTGGGLYEKTANGSRYVGALTDTVKNTSSYQELKDIYNSTYNENTYTRARGSGAGGYAAAEVLNPAASAPEVYGTETDDNGLVTAFVGWDPNNYIVSGSASSGSTSSTINKIAGYIIVGLVGLVVVDRLTR